MAAHEDAIRLDAQLYWRVKTLHEQLDELALDAESRYLVERHFREMTHAGAGLDDADKKQLTALNQKLSTSTTTFEKNLLADTNDLAVYFETAEELDGLSQRVKSPPPPGQPLIAVMTAASSSRCRCSRASASVVADEP